MRKILVVALAAAASWPALAAAQSAGEIRRGQDEVRRGEQEVQRDLRRGEYQEAREDRREVNEDRRELGEDWRTYREGNRNVFRGGRYIAPRGYRYRAVGVGHSFSPQFYASRYWISDPRRYRLSMPGRYQRWIRYGNDVILINSRNGRVLRVYRNFYW